MKEGGWNSEKPVERGEPSGGLERERATAASLASSRSCVLSRLASLATRNGELAGELLPLPSLPLCSLRSPIFFAFFAHYGTWSQTTLLDPAPLTFRGTSDGLSGKDTNCLPEPPPPLFTPLFYQYHTKDVEVKIRHIST